MVETIGLIRYEELGELLELYRQLHPEDPDAGNIAHVTRLWDEIYNDKNLFYPALKVDGKIVSSCTLAIIKNLTRGLRPYGIIENVITHQDYRKRGYGTKVLHKAIEIAREKDRYKVMLMTGSKNEETIGFLMKMPVSSRALKPALS